MYGRKFSLTTPLGGVSIGSATTVTILQLLAQAARGIIITQVSVDLVTTVATQIIVQKQSTAGTMTNSPPNSYGPGAPTLLVTGQHTATAEPTPSTLIARRWTSSSREIVWLPDEVPELAGGEYAGVTLVTAAAVVAHCTIYGREA